MSRCRTNAQARLISAQTLLMSEIPRALMVCQSKKSRDELRPLLPAPGRPPLRQLLLRQARAAAAEDPGRAIDGRAFASGMDSNMRTNVVRSVETMVRTLWMSRQGNNFYMSWLCFKLHSRPKLQPSPVRQAKPSDTEENAKACGQ